MLLLGSMTTNSLVVHLLHFTDHLVLLGVIQLTVPASIFEDGIEFLKLISGPTLQPRLLLSVVLKHPSAHLLTFTPYFSEA